ncbi:hypothetical protein WA026_002326 [Henosepilachna vigintioctopunctata]|uniref:Uncharacterized protein n=1 Tax=Henosepilachna vigintioctopunctata TaxID=420089 RepID=A0AAW1TZF1_9CUCU
MQRVFVNCDSSMPHFPEKFVNYYAVKIREAFNRTKEIWNIANQQTGREKHKNEKLITKLLTQKGETITEGEEICNEFGRYFSSMAEIKMKEKEEQ